MPAVLLHGVPDTAVMSDRFRAHLDRADVVALALPGFGTDVPDGFGATEQEYADWIADELAGIGEPVDLVGHDWGCILAQRVASQHPEMVRTLVCGGGPIDRTYEWHAMAQLWQTPGTGEEIVTGMLGMATTDLVAGLVAGGAPPELAELQAERLDTRMGECMLALYRSAITVGEDWEDDVATMPHRPVLVVWGGEDPYVGAEFGERLARRVAGELVVLDGCSHWWPWERAQESAELVTRFWSAAG